MHNRKLNYDTRWHGNGTRSIGGLLCRHGKIREFRPSFPYFPFPFAPLRSPHFAIKERRSINAVMRYRMKTMRRNSQTKLSVSAAFQCRLQWREKFRITSRASSAAKGSPVPCESVLAWEVRNPVIRAEGELAKVVWWQVIAVSSKIGISLLYTNEQARKILSLLSLRNLLTGTELRYVCLNRHAYALHTRGNSFPEIHWIA
jgi:hypothetical protein